MGLVNELSMNRGPFASFGAYADEPGYPSRNLPSQVPQLEDEALVFLLLERATAPRLYCLSPLCICWKGFQAERLATGGSSSIWVFLVGGGWW